MFRKKYTGLTTVILLGTAFFLITGGLFHPKPAQASSGNSEYCFWQKMGARAALKAVAMMRQQNIRLDADDGIAITNAGYAEIHGRATTGALDGVSRALAVGRGNHTLVEVHSAPASALWFAVYDKKSGTCAYLQVDPDSVGAADDLRSLEKENLFSLKVLERINAEHLYENAESYAEKFDRRIFGGNEFRIVTIANAVAAGAPTCAVRSFEFHDHYCPGVTSGILMALYLKTFFPLASGGSYFVQTVRPWCKEDGLLVMLNTTPGKRGYAVTYPTDEDIAGWPDWAQNAATIVYRRNPDSDTWDGVVLGYEGGDTGCPDYGHSVMNKLCADLWQLERLDQPENFIPVLKAFKLPEGGSPQDYARPGVDPILAVEQSASEKTK